MHLQTKDIKVICECEGEVIWREKTPEEKAIDKLSQMGMKRQDAQRAVYLFGSLIKSKHSL